MKWCVRVHGVWLDTCPAVPVVLPLGEGRSLEGENYPYPAHLACSRLLYYI